MFGLVVMEGMTPSGHLSNINEIEGLLCNGPLHPTSVGQGKNEKSKEPCHSLHRNVSMILYAHFSFVSNRKLNPFIN
jgi:hypothetical protein